MDSPEFTSNQKQSITVTVAAGVVQLIFYTETEGNTERAGEKSVNPRSWLYFVKKHNSSRINCSTCVGWAKNTPATIFM